jgi:HEAT repeat protein
VRRNAAEALGKIGSDKAVVHLSAALEDRNGYVRSTVAEALDRISSGKVVVPLIATLKDRDSYVRRKAAKALVKIDSGKAVAPLIATLKDDDYDTRSKAAKALVKIAESDLNLPIITQQLPHLLTLIPTESSQEALSVITAIQARCKYYNYNIAQTPLPPEDNPNPTIGNTYNFFGEVEQVIAGTIQGDNIATQNNQKTAPES